MLKTLFFKFQVLRKLFLQNTKDSKSNIQVVIDFFAFASYPMSSKNYIRWGDMEAMGQWSMKIGFQGRREGDEKQMQH